MNFRYFVWHLIFSDLLKSNLMEAIRNPASHFTPSNLALLKTKEQYFLYESNLVEDWRIEPSTPWLILQLYNGSYFLLDDKENETPPSNNKSFFFHLFYFSKTYTTYIHIVNTIIHIYIRKPPHRKKSKNKTFKKFRKKKN
jgi:hypothetical protein